MRSIESFNVIAVLNLFFWFSRGFFGFWPKVSKTSRKPKKQKKTKLQTPTHQLVPTWVLQFSFFCFFRFSRGFFGFWPKVSKTSRKPNKNRKKTKLQTLTHQLVPTWVLQFCFFCFFLFSRGFFGFWPKVSKTSRRPKKTKLQTLTHQLVPTWVLQFCFFLVFSRFFETKKTSRKPKKTIADPNSPACTYMGLAILALFAFLHDVRPCARWWLQFIKECSNCIKMTVLAHCHGRPFWYQKTHSYLASKSSKFYPLESRTTWNLRTYFKMFFLGIQDLNQNQHVA